DEETIKRLNENDQILFRYCDKEGNVDVAYNPNGSVENIAGITNKTRNVFGMMPHPERCSDAELGNTDGLVLFESLLKYIGK
ncbi:MAG: phosphoribosylformylglycinamidine synthase subunit PurQ, partial [Bacteroidales bacterium]|nr:phosphoribosylformylglycinamidine synthase subunit PurQ [Bacteroidales bacterium]